MKAPLIVLFTLLALSLKASAVTSDELARYLGVSSWTTTVFLEGGSYVVEVYEIKDGKVDHRLLEGMKEWSPKGATGVTVMIGPEGKSYRVVVDYQRGTTVGATSTFETRFGSSMSPSLPEKIGEGDYILMGEPKAPGKGLNSDISDYARGFLLRVKAAAE